jgi:hypothetical protein
MLLIKKLTAMTSIQFLQNWNLSHGTQFEKPYYTASTCEELTHFQYSVSQSSECLLEHIIILHTKWPHSVCLGDRKGGGGIKTKKEYKNKRKHSPGLLV